jgi:peroxin-3
MRTCREETAKALVGFLATARRVLDEATDTSAATKQLKELRAAAALLKTENSNIDSNEQQERLWNEVKRKSVARLIATAYALSILFLVLSVQVHLLGGRLFRVQGSDDAKDDIASRHEFVLTHLFESFFETGIERLVRAVERAVEQCWSDCNVLDPAFLEMNIQTIDRLLQKVRFQVESETNLLSFLLSDQHSSESSNNVIADSTATTILDETWDLLESPVFADAQRHCLDTTFTVLKEQHWGTIFGTDGTTLQPLATVLTKLKKTSKTFYEPSSLGSTNSYVAVIQTLSSVVELCDVSFN